MNNALYSISGRCVSAMHKVSSIGFHCNITKHRLWGWTTCVQILFPPLTSCADLDKLISLCLFPYS